MTTMSMPGRTYLPSDKDVEETGSDGNLSFYNQLTGKVETRPIDDLKGRVALERHHMDSAHPERYKDSGDVKWQLRTGGGVTAEHSNQSLKSLDKQRAQAAEREAENKRRTEEIAAQKAEAERQRQAAIQQQKFDALAKRIEFEKTNPLTARKKAASGRMFEAISPGQQYVLPEGVKPNTEAWLTEGKFVRDPFVSPEQYSTMTGGAEQRVLGKGKAPKSKGVLGEEQEETLGTPTILGV